MNANYGQNQNNGSMENDLQEFLRTNKTAMEKRK